MKKKFRLLIGLVVVIILLVIFLTILNGGYTMYNLSTGEDKSQMMCYNNSYIWGSLYTNPGKIVKFDPTNPAGYTIYILGAGDGLPVDMCAGNGSIFSGLYTSPHKIMKMNATDGTYTAFSLGSPSPARMCYANDYLWIMHDALTTKITKMDPNDGSYTEYTISGHHDACSAQFDGEWIWITGNNPPNGFLAKFNVNNNSYVVYNLNFNPSESYWDGTYLWISSWTSPAKLVKYDTSDNTYSTFVTFDYNNTYDLGGDSNNRIWCTFDTTPTGVITTTYTNSGTVINTEFPGTANTRCITYDSDHNYGWVGFFTSPASYAKLK